MDSLVKLVRGILRLRGSTDNTLIGNVGDRLKVQAALASNTATVPSWSNTLRYDDMQTATGGVARETLIATGAGWTQVYLYGGSGFLAGLILNLEDFTGWEFRLLVDGYIIFSFKDSDIKNDKLYDVDDVTDANQASLGLSKSSHDRFVWHPPLSSPLYYSSSVSVQVRRPVENAKKFQSGLVILSKET